MVKFVLRSGRKSANDTMVFVDARDEVLTFQEWLFIGKHYFNSEDDYYPVAKKFLGKSMLLAAVIAVSNGVPLEVVCQKFKLPFKPLEVVDQRVRIQTAVSKIVSSETRLEELM